MKSLLLSLLFVFSVGTLASNDKNVKEAIQKQGSIVIDVRTKEEFESGHLQSAIHIPYQDILKQIEEISTDKSQPIYLYCGSGRRAGIAKDALLKAGYKEVINAGGYKDLKPE